MYLGGNYSAFARLSDDDGSSILDDLEVDHQKEYCNNPAPALKTMANLQEVISGSADFGNQRTLVQMAGRGYQNCTLLDNHDVKCRGYSEYGEVGDPDFYDDTLGDGSPGPANRG